MDTGLSKTTTRTNVNTCTAVLSWKRSQLVAYPTWVTWLQSNREFMAWAKGAFEKRSEAKEQTYPRNSHIMGNSWCHEVLQIHQSPGRSSAQSIWMWRWMHWILINVYGMCHSKVFTERLYARIQVWASDKYTNRHPTDAQTGVWGKQVPASRQILKWASNSRNERASEIAAPAAAR